MQINLRQGGYLIDYDSNLEEFWNILPKSISINGYLSDFDDIKAILDSRDPSIYSFSDIRVK